jgi:hypothetical protein
MKQQEEDGGQFSSHDIRTNADGTVGSSQPLTKTELDGETTFMCVA